MDEIGEILSIMKSMIKRIENIEKALDINVDILRKVVKDNQDTQLDKPKVKEAINNKIKEIEPFKDETKDGSLTYKAQVIREIITTLELLKEDLGLE